MRTELDFQTITQPIVRNNASYDLKLSRTEPMMHVEHIPRRRDNINNPALINNDVKEAIGRRQRAYEAKRMINSEVSIAEYIEAGDKLNEF